MALDILAIMAHPDDAELSCSGTIIRHVEQGKKVGVIDLTQGELGTRGTPQTRKEEAQVAAQILGLTIRENLGFQDGFFKNDRTHQLGVIKYIRKYQPEIIITNATHDRHPDHARAAQLVVEATFLSGLVKIETSFEGQAQTPHRPKHIFHTIQNNYLAPDFIVDISKYRERKVKSILAYGTQFYNPNDTSDISEENQTFISTPGFFRFLEARDREFGQAIRVEYGEGFIKSRDIGISDLFHIL